jgi:hypothetical protein
LSKGIKFLAPRAGVTTTTSSAGDPFANRGDQPAPSSEAGGRSIRELEVELKLALENFKLVDQLHARAAVAQSDWAEARGKVLRLAANLGDLEDDLTDECDRLKLEIKRKSAELNQCLSRREMAGRTAALTRDTFKQGRVGTNEVIKAEGDLREAEAEIQVRKVAVEEVTLRLAQLERRIDRIKKVRTLADGVKDASPPAGEPSRR